ncbi:MAG: SCO family protein [Bacteroidetes bacterium]|nr:SCO family protein [Bacteroidota bacterium]MCH8523003.1 SCO family protein [Balneolales bacterium]
MHIILFIILFFISANSFSQVLTPPAELNEIGIEERLGDRIPGDISFFNEQGEVVTMSDLLSNGKPLIVTPIYFECPMLCNLILNGVTYGLRDLNWQIGDQFEVVTFSIDPDETPELARENKESYLRLLGKPEAADGWHFLTADEENITRMTDALGFNFKWSDEAQEFLHGSAIMFVSPQGVITRYLYGIDYSELSLRNALFDAADGRIGATFERVLLYCFTFDPNSRSYVPNAMRIMKVGGLITMTFLGIFLGLLWFRKKV